MSGSQSFGVHQTCPLRAFGSETDEKENIETNLLEVKLQVALTMFSTKKERKMYQLIKGRKGSNFEPRFCSSR